MGRQIEVGQVETTIFDLLFAISHK